MKYRNIEAERARNGMTKEMLATKLGVTTKTYNNWLRGASPIPSGTLLDMSHLFGVKIDYLLQINEMEGTQHEYSD